MEAMKREIVLKSYLENKERIDRYVSEGIEKHRKGDFVLKLASDGKKKVKITHKKHTFLFGSTAFMLDSFEKEGKEEEYKRLFAKLFNQAVVPLYWSDLEPEEGKPRFAEDSVNIYRRPPVDTVLRFCEEYGIEPKGHCMVWNGFVPKWLAEKDEAGKKAAIERRFAEISSRYAHKIPSFDIVNESAANYYRGEKALFPDYDRYGMQLGAKYFPNNIKILNETNGAIWTNFHCQGKYIPFNMQLRDFIREGIPFDEIGLQYHIFVPRNEIEGWKAGMSFLNAEVMLDVMELFNSYGYPMHLSEITVPSYAGKLPENEEIQAYLVETLYKIWFATEHMKSIVWWNLCDGYAAYAPLGSEEGENQYAGGLCHFDMTPKPAYLALDRLINGEWRTNIECECEGALSFRGFFGEYEIEVTENGRTEKHTVLFDKDGACVSLDN
jgi:GH35 family endo-1,4-beta-xylanase